MKLKFLFYLSFVLPGMLFAQLDTITYQCPVTPFNASHGLNATFCEFRNTLTSDHFHNAIDIGKADGEPCYPVINGQVYTIVNNASNSYVRVVTAVNDQWKHFTYLHIDPNPALSVGDPVTQGNTILGTIYPGMGHVHLIERELVNGKDFYAAEINNVRSNGGITPYNDTYPPVIDRNSLKFFINGSKIEMAPFGLSGHIDIRIKITEHNGTTSSQTNNGTYLAGYRIWNADTSQVVFEPKDGGVKYRFDRKPFNDYVHQVFVKDLATLSNPVYWLTNGSGATGINEEQIITNSYFNASTLDTADYLLEIFSEDTRGNRDRAWFDITITDQDLTPPARPEIYYLLNSDNKHGLKIRWKKNSDPDLLGYRLYYAQGNQLTKWQLAVDESLLTKDSVQFQMTSPDSFIVAPEQDAYFFSLRAVDSSGNESPADDIYARSLHTNSLVKDNALIVNGFNRHTGSGSWQQPTHSFVKSYFVPLNAVDSLVISSCSNAAVENGLVSLLNYDIVVWFLGDESTADDTFTSTEQGKVKSYLENGGKLFVSGSEIGWDLGRAHNASESGDQAFYNNYLKASYVYDGNEGMSPARGTAGSVFSEVQLSYGQVYPEDYPDDIDPLNGAQLIMRYNVIRSQSTYRKAGIAYSGTFGDSQQNGQLVYLAFPFETVNALEQRQNFINALMGYFSVITGISDPFANYPQKLSLSQNYPNPFNGSTRLTMHLPVQSKVVVKIFDMLGREVDQIVNDVMAAGEYTLTWNADDFASGLYLLQMQAGEFRQSKKIILLK